MSDQWLNYDIPGTWESGPSEAAPLDPQFGQAGRVHDWRNYVGHRTRAIWTTFTDGQRSAIMADAEDRAGNEDWD